MATSSLNYSKFTHDAASHPQQVLLLLPPVGVIDSTIHVIDRSELPSSIPNSIKGSVVERRLFDHATLLLSIANIAQSEITACPTALLDDDSHVETDIQHHNHHHHHHRRITPSALPSFPKYVQDGDDKYCAMGSKQPRLSLIPRNESSLRHSILIGGTRASQRHRSVSFDSPTSVMNKIIVHPPWESASPPSTTSPLLLPRSPSSCRNTTTTTTSSSSRFDDEEKTTTPKRSNKSYPMHHGSHNKKARLESPRIGSTSNSGRCCSQSRNRKLPDTSTAIVVGISQPRLISNETTCVHDRHNNNNVNNNNISSSHCPTSAMITTATQQLQGTPPDGVTIRQVNRRKFSWKNYPQLEEFLISNREEYLRHSALNYTIEQKNYNNQLTQDLLSLATQCGYLFDTTDFTFVTVRDRIRCYYKSYVQSAKKRGILMGYAAKKAGLLSNVSKSQRSYDHHRRHHHSNSDDDDMSSSCGGGGNDSDSIDIH